MPFKRRIFLYLIGVFIGGLLAFKFYGDRLTSGGWLPEERVKKRLSSTLISATPVARQQLQEWPAELSDLRMAMPHATVDIGDSKRTPDSIYYHVTADVNGRDAQLVIAVLRDLDKDTTATLWSIHPR